ncbi:hypothetical protein LOTGIDRAFT_204287 [Lottia gigantea]|uniref:CN hydrolase domain-containing protein n=1 Tax=Lottia gigantea TaxID=225164 RepID=V4BM43_LOTGI|nr:hypothetical protein LOTGIDRAFT_204287 [Lottia gigantea]ESO89939.1 hypothetical protein LOTGIDRAFT_204287 [Lottia gigantea]
MLSSGLLTIILVSLVVSEQRQAFKAAVYEHDVILPEPRATEFSRQEAIAITMKNLVVFNQQAMVAAQESVEIMVFPQGGLYGMGFDRRNITPFLEAVPMVTKDLWNPCTQSTKHASTKIQFELSCIARNNSLFVVANLASKAMCDGEDDDYKDENCPEDGFYIYNTVVVFDNNGNLIAKYNQFNIPHNSVFDYPHMSEMVTFDTPFGIFGVLMCNDLNQFDPAVRMIEEMGISNFVCSGSSSDNPPSYVTIREQAGFARGYGVNLLAANVHKPLMNKVGSGIFTPDRQTRFYYDNRQGSDGRLVIATARTLRKPLRHNIPEYTTKLQSKGPSPDTFVTKVNGIPYTMSRLDKPQGTFKLCHSEICCELEYKISLRGGDEYVFAIQNGYIHGGNKYLFSQSCIIIRCVNSTEEECGIPQNSAHSYFTHLRIKGYFSTKHVYPQFLVNNRGQLDVAPVRFHYSDGVLWSRQVTFPLESAGFIGRIFSRDGVNSASSASFSLFLLFVSLCSLLFIM